MSENRIASVWDAIEDTPEDAESMRLRSVVLAALQKHIKQSGLTQAASAKLLTVSQPRISDLMLGKINLFGFDSLLSMATAASLHIKLRVTPFEFRKIRRSAVKEVNDVVDRSKS
jgi:predicted XRE-type DNA-binding protein